MKPTFFIGSSSEQLDIAYALQENLERDAEVTVWTQGLFELTKSTLESLTESLDDFDFAAFVFAPDDVTRMRDAEYQIVRDNVVFELGLFVGHMGRSRVFIVVPRGTDTPHFPSDLLGITPTSYEPNRQDGNLVAALGPSANRIRKAVIKHGKIVSVVDNDVTASTEPTADYLDYNDNDFISILESWMGSRSTTENTQVIKYSDVDEELRLPKGTCEKHIEIAASKWSYVLARKGKQTITFKDMHEEPW